MDFILLLLWLSLAAFFVATALAAMIRYRPPVAAEGDVPSCSIVLPIKGVSEFLESNLRALMRLSPFRGEILLAVASEDDPACAVIRRVLADGGNDAKLLIGEDTAYVNPKLRNVSKAYQAAREDIIVFLDDSVALGGALFAELVQELKPGTVAVTAAPRGEDATSFFSAIEAASCNGYLFRIQMFLEMFGLAAAFGNAFAFRKTDLEAVGGFGRLQEGPCEDSAIATALRETGKRLTLLRSGVRRRIGYRSWRDIYLRHLRWASCTKVHDPVVFFIEPLIGGLVFNVLGAYVLSQLLVIPAANALLISAALWYGTEALLHLVCGWPLHLLSLPAWIARDVLQPVFMIAARLTNQVQWRGISVAMNRDPVAKKQ
jgi:ceramide glucosyltransferase